MVEFMNSQISRVEKLFREGSALLQSGNAADALALFQTAQNIDPLNATILLHAGSALHDLGRYEEAVACYRLAIASEPSMGEIHNNLGNSLMALGRFSEATDSLLRASELLPTSPIPPAARATALQALGNIFEAEYDCRKALAVDPDFASAHWNLALNLLLQGRYEEGWREYEWRWLKPDFTSPLRHSDVPLWEGSPLNGRTILLHAEQGFGDAIQFVRYATLVAQCGGRVSVECHPQLAQLFQSIEGVNEVVPFGTPLPPFSCQAPLLSLPLIFNTTLQAIPSRYPYLSTSAEYRDKWGKLIFCDPSVLRIGLVWAGKNYPDPLRSCRLEDFAPLATIHNVLYYSLQMGDGAEQTASPPSGMHLIDLTSQICNFADTAALIEHLDLVISIDTAVAHLAGAMGKPVYLMLPFAPDWRWLLGRGDSPWYPTMRIFRQKQSGEWRDVVDSVYNSISKSYML